MIPLSGCLVCKLTRALHFWTACHNTMVQSVAYKVSTQMLLSMHLLLGQWHSMAVKGPGGMMFVLDVCHSSIMSSQCALSIPEGNCGNDNGQSETRNAYTVCLMSIAG